MEKRKVPVWQRTKTILIVLLTLSMLLLAGIYIGGAQGSGGTAAIRTSDLPSGTAILGEDAVLRLPLYEKELLPVAFAGILYGGKGGGAYGTEQAASALLSFAAEPVHRLLSKEASFSEITAADFAAVTEGDFICLNFLSPLPYQMLYALTGEVVSAAGSQTAISADRMLLSFTANGKATLYLSDGSRFYAAEADVTVKPAELAAMANDSRLADFSVTENGIALSAEAPQAPKVSLCTASVNAEQYTEILSLLSYDPDSAIAPASTDSYYGTAVAPHGSLQMDESGLSYTAARASGIPVSNFLDTAKSELDIDIYDILLASVSLTEKLRALAPEAFAEGANLYLDGFYHEEDTFTVVFGLCANSIEISGTAYPYFARLTAQGGMFKSIDAHFAKVTKNSYTGMLFPSLWQYNYAAKTAKIDSLRLCYCVQELGDAWMDASWYFTGNKQDAEVAK